MYDDLPFIPVKGDKTTPDLTLMALSTCGFCKKGMAFLEGRGFSFRYIFLDEIDTARKASAKEEFMARFGKPLSYPTLILNDSEIVIGFIREVWEEKLGGLSQ